MQSKHPLTRALFIFVICSVVCVVAFLISIRTESWYSIVTGLISFLSLVAGVGQLFVSHQSFPTALQQLPSYSQTLIQQLFTSTRTLVVKGRRHSKLLLSICMLVAIAMLIGYTVIPRLPVVVILAPTATKPTTAPPLTFVAQTRDGQQVGISDGRFVFDLQGRDPKKSTDAPTTNPLGHRNAALKIQAAEAYRNGDYATAARLWNLSVSSATDSDDAEVRIYLENLSVLSSHKPYVTFLVVTQLTGSPNAYNVGRINADVITRRRRAETPVF